MTFRPSEWRRIWIKPIGSPEQEVQTNIVSKNYHDSKEGDRAKKGETSEVFDSRESEQERQFERRCKFTSGSR